tara:strand:+ start:61969 stop:62136 length:168 start_codon:yes stop_codon:yes gene_type:complete
MATANKINKKAVSLVENRKLAIFFCIALGLFLARAKIGLFDDLDIIYELPKSVKI